MGMLWKLVHPSGIILHYSIYLHDVFSVTMDIWWKCSFNLISEMDLASMPISAFNVNKQMDPDYYELYPSQMIWTKMENPKLEGHAEGFLSSSWSRDPYLCTHVGALFRSILSRTHSHTAPCVYHIYSWPLCHNIFFPPHTMMNTGTGLPEYNFQ